jgi:hypothetical protein
VSLILSPQEPACPNPFSVPPNVNFQIDDVESEWTYSSKFDFIFGRMLVGSISDWPGFIQRSFECVPTLATPLSHH